MKLAASFSLEMTHPSSFAALAGLIALIGDLPKTVRSVALENPYHAHGIIGDYSFDIRVDMDNSLSPCNLYVVLVQSMIHEDRAGITDLTKERVVAAISALVPTEPTLQEILDKAVDI